MANEGYFEEACKDFDRDYEQANAIPIAFDRGRIDWDTVTPQNAFLVIHAATVGLACRVLELSVGGRRK